MRSDAYIFVLHNYSLSNPLLVRHCSRNLRNQFLLSMRLETAFTAMCNACSGTACGEYIFLMLSIRKPVVLNRKVGADLFPSKLIKNESILGHFCNLSV